MPKPPDHLKKDYKGKIRKWQEKRVICNIIKAVKKGTQRKENEYVYGILLQKENEL